MSTLEHSVVSLLNLGSSIHHANKESERRFGLSLVQWCLLKHLIDMPSASARSLAKEAGVHPSTLTQTIKRLARKKLIFILEDPKDSRRKLISITRLGKDMMESTATQMTSWLSGLAALERDLDRISVSLNNSVSKQV